MSQTIQPGSTVQVKVTTRVTNDAAAKTLSRIFAKDLQNKRARHTRKRMLQRQVRGKTRGGRTWYYRPKAPAQFQPTIGDQCQLLATSDVIRDLGSVQRFVDVS